jgi:hypothetical protein
MINTALAKVVGRDGTGFHVTVKGTIKVKKISDSSELDDVEVISLDRKEIGSIAVRPNDYRFRNLNGKEVGFSAFTYPHKTLQVFVPYK